MAATAPAPTEESILLAMRSDLGLGRVDDLRLEDGRKGRTIRPGDASHVLKVAAAPPQTVLPVAGKWLAAIKQGDFDDEDADAVKGLDRIGGGRLHALNSTPPALAIDSSRSKRPPPGLSSSRSEVGPVVQQRTSSAKSENILTKTKPHRIPYYTPRKEVPSQDHRSASSGGKEASFSQNYANKQVFFPSAIVAPLPQAAFQRADFVLPPDAEPPEYFYKEQIYVADLFAKGAGFVYLVRATYASPTTIQVFLKGTRYFEYPIWSMFNYISSSTTICPQFKESDGISIFTTSLIFASQQSVAEFMTTVKTTKAQLLALSGNQQETFSRPTLESALLPHISRSPKLTVSSSMATLDTEPDTTELTQKEEQREIEVACDLLNLSQPEEIATYGDAPNLVGSSVHALDLVSLTFPLSETISESLTSISVVESPTSCKNQLEMESLIPDCVDAESINQACKSEAREELFHPTSTVDFMKASAKISPELPAPAELLERLQSELLEILPKIEAVGSILSSLEKGKQVAAAKYVLAQLKEKRAETAEFQLSTAERLLQSLVTSSKNPQSSAQSCSINNRSYHRYSFDDMKLLRKHAVQPGKELLKFKCSPDIIPLQIKRLERAHITASSPQDYNRILKKTTLNPDAKPFSIRVDLARARSEPEPQLASMTNSPEMQAPTLSSHESNAFCYTKNLPASAQLTDPGAQDAPQGLKTAEPAREITQAQAPVHNANQKPILGLRSSRWAPTDQSSNGNKASS